MKRVYFAGSIRGGREDLALHAALIARLREPERGADRVYRGKHAGGHRSRDHDRL